MSDDKTLTDIAPTDNFSNALNSILSNPEMLSLIGSMAKQLKSDAEAGADKADAVSAATTAPSAQSPPANEPSVSAALSALAPLLSGNGVKLSKRDNDRACLLRALKPYLSHDRAEAIDYIIKFSSLAEVLKKLS